MIVQLIFDIYQAESRRWLHSDQPDYDHGIAVLRRALQLLISGIGGGQQERTGGDDGPAGKPA